MKKVYLERQIIRLIRKKKYIILYGAGMVGELVCKRLLEFGNDKKILGFAVSKKFENAKMDEKCCGFPIYEIRELEGYKKNAVVIISTLSNLHEEIKKNLVKLHFENIICVTEVLYSSFERHYIKTFQKRKSIAFPEDSETKVLFMASDNSRTSGAFLCMAELCETLLKNKIAVMVILPQYGTGEELLIKKRIPYYYIMSKDWGYEIKKDRNYSERLKFGISLLRNCKAKRQLSCIIKEYSVSLVHCNTTYTYIGACAAKKCDIPYVWHLRENLENQGYRIFFKSKAMKLMQESGKVIAVSDYIKELMPFKNKKRIITIYDAVEMEAEQFQEHEIFQSDVIRMIQVGAITPYKRQKELIEACEILKRKRILKFHLLVVGKEIGNYASELRDMIRMYELDDYITFCGASDNVSEFYKKSDISFMCGEKEAYGRVTIESQLSGCLMIGVNAGGTAELIKEGRTGYLYKAGDAEALAEKIIFAVDNSELSRKIAKAGQEYARRVYTREKNFHEIKDIYEKVLGKQL